MRFSDCFHASAPGRLLDQMPSLGCCWNHAVKAGRNLVSYIPQVSGLMYYSFNELKLSLFLFPKKRVVRKIVALTSVVMKCSEKIIINLVKTEVSHSLDPLQFAYRCNRSTDDAVIALVHFISKHLEESTSCARLLFVDFNSACNTVQPHLLTKTLMSTLSLLDGRDNQMRVQFKEMNQLLINVAG